MLACYCLAVPTSAYSSFAAVWLLFHNSKVCVGEHMSDEVPIHIGLKQGDALLPLPWLQDIPFEINGTGSIETE
jgi:hypothetical protein